MRGDEYNEIFPVWDWTLLPSHRAGLDHAALPADATTEFVGGASVSIGVAVIDLNKASTTARRHGFSSRTRWSP